MEIKIPKIDNTIREAEIAISACVSEFCQKFKDLPVLKKMEMVSDEKNVDLIIVRVKGQRRMETVRFTLRLKLAVRQNRLQVIELNDGTKNWIVRMDKGHTFN